MITCKAVAFWGFMLPAAACQTVDLNEQAPGDSDSSFPDGGTPGTGADTGTSGILEGTDSSVFSEQTDSATGALPDGGTESEVASDSASHTVSTDTGNTPSTDSGTGQGTAGTDTGGMTDSATDTGTATQAGTGTGTDTAADTGTPTISDSSVPTATVTEAATETATGTESATETPTETAPDLQDLLVHRWSFTGTLADSVGGSNAQIVTPGDGSGGDAAVGSTEVTLSGGSGANSDYLSLGNQLLTSVGGAFTVELWATQISVQSWSRIFEFGGSTENYLNMCWTMGTDIGTDRVAWRGPAATTQLADSNQPYTLGTEFHIVMIVEPGADTDSLTRVTWYSAPSASENLGARKSFFLTANTLAGLEDTDGWLGRTHFTQNDTANASYNEVRIWEGVLSDANLETLHDLGPDVLP